MDVEVDVQHASNEPHLPDKGMLTRWVNAALQCQIPLNLETPKSKLQNPKSVELTIRIVDETEARQLNEQWRQRPYPTNVLSFPFECPPGIEDIALLGDIVVCAPLLASEAIEQHKPLHAHWAHLIIHGTLHLLGYDHIDSDQASAMESLEICILHNLGYPNPYHPI
ncbi:rRNA maturation RNase YbeY [Candidatus Parabeggiatoa sp. HSG14]|uniref:rRNA maturation RNase YbeY n=1 Tax=Candidatus Parabeggiatoa sp. HSG14 TaxID=3055593 RepID=UPI0025A6F446|nr:rRNA maturation RNase YbeY [Thiotrichales bacterium HSG14]